MKRLETEVLVVGAGPVGLALAGDLGWRGRSCIVVERGDGSIYQPKMDMVGIRTMEFCRRWGIVGDVEASDYPRDYPQDNVYVTGLNGYELGRARFPSMGADKPSPASPQKRERCPQNFFDPILTRFARSFVGVSLRYKHELLSFADDGVRITARIRDLQTGNDVEIAARYIVGCDGAKSRVRECLDIEMAGNPRLTHTTNIIFRCPNLNALHPKDPAYRFILIGEEGTWATIVAINGRDQWRMSIIGSARERTYTEAEIRALAVKAVGRDFDFEILSIVPWSRGELNAVHYGRGRAFIAGDACHVMSPTGGFGMNTGIGDAVDLSWKLAANLEGWGGRTLLDSYEAERRPVGLANVREASANLARMMSPGHQPRLLEDSAAGAALRETFGREFSAAMSHEWHTLHIHLGYCYADSPVIVADKDNGDWPVRRFQKYEASTRPGARAPHVWLDDSRSSLDFFGKGYVMLATDARLDPADLRRAASAQGAPLRVVAADGPALKAAYGEGLILVRPDGHVAWRGHAVPAGPTALLDIVTGARALEKAEP